MNKKELGIYIHIPFCKKKCYYCDFLSYANNCKNVEEYIKTVIKEIESYNLENYNITTIYIGGGTPSYIDSKYIVEILAKLKQKLQNNETKFNNIEITIEVNPGTITNSKIKDYKKSGINRISIGLQSTNNNLLKEIGRIHTFEEFLEAYNIVKKEFDNINIDLMIGLPKQKILDIKKSLEEIIKLNPNHVSVYSLILEEGTVLYKKVENNDLELPSEDEERKMYWYVKNTLELNGYKHYEISNFAKKEKESKHNMNCWEQKEYIGIGAAAHSYFENKRYSNVESMEKYINNFNEKIVHEVQNKEDMQKEYMLLNLRKLDGVSILKFKEKFACNPIFLFRNELEKLINEKLLMVDGNFIKLTNKGLDLANLVWEEFV